jgi:hypothetical protein
LDTLPSPEMTGVMACKSCGSDDQLKFDAEINIHLPGREALDKRAVLVFPMLLVCLHCGFAEFIISNSEWRQLAQGVAA